MAGQATYEGERGRAELERRVELFLDARQEQKRIAETARVVEVRNWLPLRPGGFLSSDMGELLDRDIDWFLGERELLCNKREGLDRILKNLTIPEDPANLGNAEPYEKFWFHRLGIASATKVAYVPIGYIP